MTFVVAASTIVAANVKSLPGDDLVRQTTTQQVTLTSSAVCTEDACGRLCHDWVNNPCCLAISRCGEGNTCYCNALCFCEGFPPSWQRGHLALNDSCEDRIDECR